MKANLVRDGIDLAFETDLLYLNVNDERVGINTDQPTHDLHVSGTARFTNLTVDTQATLGEINITGNTITSDNEVINFIPLSGETVVYQSRLQVGDFEITGNKISTIVSSSNIELEANGSGIVDILSNSRINGDLTVTGNVDVTGNVTIGGNITIGDETTDTITVSARFTSDLIPDVDGTVDIGTPSLKWRNIYADNLITENISLTSLDLGLLMFRDNEITTTTNQDLILYGNGTGGVRLGNFRFSENTLENVSTNAVSELISTGTGYFKIDGTNGVVIPRGTVGERPGYAVLGMMRFNTTSRAIEIYDGFGWASPVGPSGALTAIESEDIAAAYAIALG